MFIFFFFYSTPLPIISTFSLTMETWSSQLYFPKLGVADGSILVFDVPSRGTGVKLQETLSGHVASISDIHASGNVMVSADESGNLVTWKAGGHFTKLQEIEGAG